MQRITDWLEKLGMSEYAERFAENKIDISVLPDLTDQHLKDLGIALGDRLKILRAIRNLDNASVAATAPSTPVATPPTWQDDAERRQVTVMFSDLVGSTALSARMDPEDLRDVISTYQKCVAETVARFDGFVAKYMGDGVLVYFGYPQAHEDDAERAVGAGLALVEAVGKLRIQEPFQVRVGIATGLVVVGDLIGSGEAQERGIVGETPNLAARLQSLAEPGAVVISASTHKLIGGLFEYRNLGTVAIKGFAENVPAWQVLGASTVESRFEAMRTATAPLVGRDEDIDLLIRRWQQAKRGDGQVVLISGEPGIGKSRIAQTVLERISAEPHTRLRYFCSPHHQDSALYPSITQLERAAGLRRDDTDRQRLDKLEAIIAQGTNDLSTAVPLLAELLSIPTGGRYPPLTLTPQKRKEKTLHAQIAQVQGLARRQPVLMVWEDVHWSDPTTRESLDLLVERVPTLRVLVIMTFRPEFTSPWVGRPHVTLLSLSRLPPRQRAEMIMQVTGGKSLPKEIADEIVDRTDGVPLFIEELTKAVVESGMVIGEHFHATGPLTPLTIPTSLHASLLARLDRLAPAREVAQIAAALGRHFSHELICAIALLPQQQLDDALVQLVSAELMFRRGTPPDAEYTFKHAMVQDAAYSTLVRSRRQQIHSRIAATLEEKFPDIVVAQPEQLARHCAEAGLVEKAVGYWLGAGQQAVARSANAEALSHLGRGLELLKEMSDATEVRQQEIRLLVTRAVALRIAKGYGSDELLATLVRARKLCQLHGDPRQMFQVLFGLWTATAGRGDWPGAWSLGEECLAIARQQGDTSMLIEAHRLLGSTAVYMAEHRTAEHQFREALSLYQPRLHRANALLYGYDPGTTCNGYISWALWLQGKVTEALAASEASIRLAIESEHAPNLAVSYGWATFLNLCTQDVEALNILTTKLIAHCEEHGFPHWLALGKIGRGWCLARSGEVADGLEWLQIGIEEFRNMWGGFLVSAFLVCLADVLRIKGCFIEATDALDRSLVMIQRSNERIWEPENHRLRGEVARDAGQFQEAATAFQKAIKIARGQSARSLELRAATGLARLWRDQSKRKQAHDLLAPVYGWFIEGLDTLDLKQAKALLEELT
ncbi:adenylate/guanylate cyclase domain-containing protein [Bradyrhizobium sp. CER78]|uniref:adenylate/guanylate cyclase domain-containing protein n=1 Tax=Bradyrhizobium sp. CER78 TaxID=3039162 RepID=UPI00244A0D3D|nr:adenylate/guanylate cyclase domain-containing protein [Bradyrhizobium sp. CER78]MDH2386706.1 adenylate/guanylate cyclase domain-containing protein [Bradyrhizobium sp. CER78]